MGADSLTDPRFCFFGCAGAATSVVSSVAESTVAIFRLAFTLALLASVNLVAFDADDASGSIFGVDTAVNLAEGFSGAEACTGGCACKRSLLPLLLASVAGVFTVAVLPAELCAASLPEDWRMYQPPAPTSNRPAAAIAPIKNFLLDLPAVAISSETASCSSARKWVPKDEGGRFRLAFSGVSVISVTDRSSSTGISPKSSVGSCARVSGNAAEAAAALRAKGSSQEGILISSESSMDFDGWVELLDVKRGAGAFIGFAVSGMSGLATLCGDDGMASSEAGEEFVEPDCGVGA